MGLTHGAGNSFSAMQLGYPVRDSSFQTQDFVTKNIKLTSLSGDKTDRV